MTFLSVPVAASFFVGFLAAYMLFQLLYIAGYPFELMRSGRSSCRSWLFRARLCLTVCAISLIKSTRTAGTVAVRTVIHEKSSIPEV